MERIENSRLRKVEKKLNISNIMFAALISISIAVAVGIVGIAVLIVLIKGMPNLWTSISSPEIKYALRLSLSTSVAATALCAVLALPVSYGMARLDFRGKRIISAIFGIPMSLPPIVSGVALLAILGTTPIGRMLKDSGVEFIFTPKGIVLAQFFVNLPYMIRILRSTFEGIDPRMEHMARSLGCSKLCSFMKVSVPLAKNGFIASVVITWSKALGEFGSVLMVAGATRMRTETLPASIFLNISCGDLELAMASAAILILISMTSLFIFELLCSRARFGRTLERPGL